MKYREIAKRLWPEDRGEPERKVGRYLKNARKLIKHPPICAILDERHESRKNELNCNS
jgi:hypothetical protein